MAGILISLLLVFLVFFIMTRTVWVRIIKGKDFKVEIHLPILAIHIVKKNDNGDKRKNPKSKDKKISYNTVFMDLGQSARSIIALDVEYLH